MFCKESSGLELFQNGTVHKFYRLKKRRLLWNTAGLKCRSQVTGQVTGHGSGHRSHTKTIGHWTKLFLIDILLYKNKTSQGTSIMFFSVLNFTKFHTRKYIHVDHARRTEKSQIKVHRIT